MTVDFQVDIGHLLTLRSRLGALHADLTGGGPSSSAAASSGVMRANLDPRTTLPSAVVRANRDSLAEFAYGSLNESDPLGQMHDQVAESVLALVDGLQGMVEAMISAVGGGGARYGEAESSVAAAIAAVGEGWSGGGFDTGPGLGSSPGSAPGPSSDRDTSFGSGSSSSFGGGTW